MASAWPHLARIQMQGTNHSTVVSEVSACSDPRSTPGCDVDTSAPSQSRKTGPKLGKFFLWGSEPVSMPGQHVGWGVSAQGQPRRAWNECPDLSGAFPDGVCEECLLGGEWGSWEPAGPEAELSLLGSPVAAARAVPGWPTACTSGCNCLQLPG